MVVAGKPRQHVGFIGRAERYIDGIDQLDGILAARIVAALGHGKAHHGALCHAEPGGDCRQHGFGGVIEGKLEFGKAQHGLRLYPLRRLRERRMKTGRDQGSLLLPRRSLARQEASMVSMYSPGGS